MSFTGGTPIKESPRRRVNSSAKAARSATKAPVTWENLRDNHLPVAIETFLWQADVANVIGTIDTEVLKVAYYDGCVCIISCRKGCFTAQLSISDPGQFKQEVSDLYMYAYCNNTLAYQLLQDLVLNSPESLFSANELDKWYNNKDNSTSCIHSIRSAIESLQTWISRERVLEATFDFLSTIYFRDVKHDYPGTSIIHTLINYRRIQ